VDIRIKQSGLKLGLYKGFMIGLVPFKMCELVQLKLGLYKGFMIGLVPFKLCELVQLKLGYF